jgi:hypothetical protein
LADKEEFYGKEFGQQQFEAANQSSQAGMGKGKGSCKLGHSDIVQEAGAKETAKQAVTDKAEHTQDTGKEARAKKQFYGKEFGQQQYQAANQSSRAGIGKGKGSCELGHKGIVQEAGAKETAVTDKAEYIQDTGKEAREKETAEQAVTDKTGCKPGHSDVVKEAEEKETAVQAATDKAEHIKDTGNIVKEAEETETAEQAVTDKAEHIKDTGKEAREKETAEYAVTDKTGKHIKDTGKEARENEKETAEHAVTDNTGKIKGTGHIKDVDKTAGQKETAEQAVAKKAGHIKKFGQLVFETLECNKGASPKEETVEQAVTEKAGHINKVANLAHVAATEKAGHIKEVAKFEAAVEEAIDEGPAAEAEHAVTEKAGHIKKVAKLAQDVYFTKASRANWELYKTACAAADAEEEADEARQLARCASIRASRVAAAAL